MELIKTTVDRAADEDRITKRLTWRGKQRSLVVSQAEYSLPTWQTCSFLSVLTPPVAQKMRRAHTEEEELYTYTWYSKSFSPSGVHSVSLCLRNIWVTQLRFLLNLPVMIWAWPQAAAGNALNIDTYNKLKIWITTLGHQPCGFPLKSVNRVWISTMSKISSITWAVTLSRTTSPMHHRRIELAFKEHPWLQ